jgi:choice-of-anchor B domain-containing protein
MRIIFTGFVLLFSFVLNAQNLNMELLGRLEYSVELSDIWGYQDEEGNEYALVGLNNNFSVVDVTDGANPTEVFRTIGGSSSAWRDIKTWGDYAYITCECGPGLLIVDLSPLPQSSNLTYTYWVGDSLTFYQAHNLFIDENGIAYIFGAFYSAGGAIMLDLNDDPMDPKPIGMYDEEYLHDGVVRGDTLWGSAVNIGEMQVIDVSDKTNPVKMSSWKTPSSFTHNAWFSDDNKYLFTTDEVRNGSIAAYNVSNIYNPTEMDVWKVSDTAIIPHNTHWMNDFLITSHYTIGVNIIDVKRPNNMIQTGVYDTSPDYNYEGFHGAWGAYPFLPSGKILVSDIETGLYVFQPTYVRGCYLEGTVKDLHTNGPIFFPTIKILENNTSTDGDIVGDFAIATLDAGNYTVAVSADGYFPDTIENVSLSNGELTVLDVKLSNWPVGVSESNFSHARFAFYPNPSTGWLEYENSGDFDGLVIYDLLGREVLRDDLKDARGVIRLEFLPNGTYRLVVSNSFSNLEYSFIVAK